MPATDLKIGTFVLIPNFQTLKRISKKLQPLRKGPYQIIDKPTEVTYKLTESTIKETVQHRNNLLPYYPKEYALRELTQLYSFTGLKIIQNITQIEQKTNNSEKENKSCTIYTRISHTKTGTTSTISKYENLSTKSNRYTKSPTNACTKLN